MAMDPNGKLSKALSTIQKAFGKGAIMSLGDDELRAEVKTFSSGSLGLDIALGCGGIPRGRVVEIYGPESSGKTTLTLAAIAQVQAQNGAAAFIDAEHSFDPGYAAQIGVKLDELLVSQPDSGEQALEIAEILVRSEEVDLVVIDSVAALVPRAEIDGEMGASHVGLQARLMSQALRKLTSVAHKSGCTVFFINQLRQKIGVTFGSPETTTGGNALKFYASVRLDIRRIGSLKQGNDPIGNRTRVKVVKNKLAPPFRETEFDLIFGRGVNKPGEIVDLAVEHELIDKSGSWYSYEGNSLGQGRDNAAQTIADTPELAAVLEQAIRAKVGLPASDSAPSDGSCAEGGDALAEEEPSRRRRKRAAGSDAIALA
jgi:recombination protein RecA